jgi:flagellar biosynthesis GTPase FlhF
MKENIKAGGGQYVEEREMAIDVELRTQIEEEGQREIEKLKKRHKRKIEELKHMREILKTKCWEEMKQHKQSVTGIQSKIVVYNFGIKKKEKMDEKKVKLGKWFGRMQNLENRLWNLDKYSESKNIKFL